MELIKQLKNDGTAKGLCRLWQGKLRSGMDMDALVRLYVSGLDFCIVEDFPTLEFLRENFKGKCEPYGVFIDDDVTDRINASDMVLNGHCKAMLEYNDYSVCRVFIRHSSQAAINVSDKARVTIDAFDDSIVVVATTGEDARAVVNLYGSAKVECFGNGIKIKYKNRLTY